MQASHDEIIVRIMDRRGRAPSEARPLVVPAGSHLQDLLASVLSSGMEDLHVTVNGRSASRLHPLLAGDMIEIHACAAE